MTGPSRRQRLRQRLGHGVGQQRGAGHIAVVQRARRVLHDTESPVHSTFISPSHMPMAAPCLLRKAVKHALNKRQHMHMLPLDGKKLTSLT